MAAGGGSDDALRRLWTLRMATANVGQGGDATTTRARAVLRLR